MSSWKAETSARKKDADALGRRWVDARASTACLQHAENHARDEQSASQILHLVHSTRSSHVSRASASVGSTYIFMRTSTRISHPITDFEVL